MNDSSPAPSDPGVDEVQREPEADIRYTREGLIGQGGMGRVYAARDTRLRRQVALKVAATPELAARLAREAWITAQLEHPGIVAVYDAGETDGQAWYTMRLIRGRTLRERLAECPDMAARLLLLPHLHAASQAVAYAHSMGVVHRDLKPSNIMVGEFGETQVADWGLATPIDTARTEWRRIVGSAEVARPQAASRDVYTRPGVDPSTPEPNRPGPGTPGFMSPEQARGAPAATAADVYALGAALQELLDGPPRPRRSGVASEARSDSSGSTPATARARRARGEVGADAPPELLAIARRCLQDDPAARYPDAGALADDLDRWLSGRRVHAHEYRPVELLVRLVRAWRVPLAVAGIAALALTVVIAIAVERTARERAAAEANLAVALTGQALAALLDERLPEAHVLASHALAYGPSAEARGILAATRRSTAERVWRAPMPEGCRHTGVFAEDATSLACPAAGKLELWRRSEQTFAPVATLDIAVVEEPVWVGQNVFVATSDALVWVVDNAPGPVVPGPGWRPMAANGFAYATRGPLARTVQLDGTFIEFPLCPTTRAATQVVDDTLVVGCDDGVLRRYAADGSLIGVITLGDRPAWSASLGVPGGLLVGGLDGDVRWLLLGAPGAASDATQETSAPHWLSPPLRGPSRSVLSFQPVPGTSVVLVLGERGGPRIWNTDAGGWSGALPAGATRMDAGLSTGEVLTIGEDVELWRIGATPRPTVLSFDAGVSQATPSPSGDALAVALGSGDVVERRLFDGHELRRWHWIDGVAKCVAYGDEDHLVAGAMGAPGRILGPGPATAPIPDPRILRRAGRLADGRVWALDYAGNVVLISTTAMTVQPIGPGPFDGSSSPDGGTAAVLDNRGGVWVLDAAASSWSEVRRATDAIAVDIGDGGSPLVLAERRRVCVDDVCHPVKDDIIDVALHGEHIAIGTLSGDVTLLDVSTGVEVARMRGHTGRISTVEFAPDGSWLVSASWDGTARIWDLTGLDEPAGALIAYGERTWGLALGDAMRGH